VKKQIKEERIKKKKKKKKKTWFADGGK